MYQKIHPDEFLHHTHTCETSSKPKIQKITSLQKYPSCSFPVTISLRSHSIQPFNLMFFISLSSLLLFLIDFMSSCIPGRMQNIILNFLQVPAVDCLQRCAPLLNCCDAFFPFHQCFIIAPLLILGNEETSIQIQLAKIKYLDFPWLFILGNCWLNPLLIINRIWPFFIYCFFALQW